MIYIEGVDATGVAYAVYAGIGVGELADQGLAMPASYGESVHGTERIIAALTDADGARVLLTPTGPVVALSAQDESSVAAWLRANTEAALAGQFNVSPEPPDLPGQGDQVVY